MKTLKDLLNWIRESFVTLLIIGLIIACILLIRTKPINLTMPTSDTIVLESMVDSVTIVNVIINRGYCISPYPDSKKPGVLLFGQQIKIPTTNCNVREVVIVTDETTYKYRIKDL